MKKLFAILLLLTIAAHMFGQQKDTTQIRINENYQVKVVESKEGTKIYLGGKAMFELRELQDTTTVQLGNKKLIVSETRGKTIIEVMDDNTREKRVIYDENNSHHANASDNTSLTDTLPDNDTAKAENKDQERHKEEKDAASDQNHNRWSDFEDLDDFNSKEPGTFKGNWFSVDWGFNNYLGPDGSIARTDENRYMDLNTGRSWNFNFNFSQYSIGLISDRAGLVTGLGIEINNYHFDGNNTITKENGEIMPSYRFDTSTIEIRKNRFSTTYLTVPLIFEAQLTSGERKERLFIEVGVIGGVRVGSHIKVKYREDGNKKKYKERGDDYNLNPFRYGLTARAGYKAFSVFSRYYLTPLFEKGNGPELYPLSIGFSLNM